MHLVLEEVHSGLRAGNEGVNDSETLSGEKKAHIKLTYITGDTQQVV